MNYFLLKIVIQRKNDPTTDIIDFVNKRFSIQIT